MLKMDIKKISKLIEKAKRTYRVTPKNYNQILGNNKKTQVNENSSNSNFSETANFEEIDTQTSNSDEATQNLQSQEAQNLNSNYNGPPINFIGPQGGFSQAPINIIAKNYIDTAAIEEHKIGREHLEAKSLSKTLAKIPDKLLKASATNWEPINFRDVNVKYDLYEGSCVEINYDEKAQKLIYQIIEPELNLEEEGQLEELKRAFIYVFEKFSPEYTNISGKELIIAGTKKICAKYKIKLDDLQFKKITYRLVRDFLGLELLEPMMHDPNIEDISCDGLNVPIFVNHLKYGPLEVNREFNDPLKLNSFIIKLAQRSNQEISLSKPILQGALPDGSRIEAIYGKEISEKGSSFTIRKFREEPFTPIHLIDLGTMPTFLLAYLWLAIENKQSLLVSGGTATGKTTILNALSLFVPPTAKIVSIEDTPEINLPHEHWLPMISRQGEGKAEVDMFELLKASLRERPDYIIVGEIRGAEASILFQGMATGHAGMGTVHAEKFQDLINRMTIAPINLPKQLLTELDIAIFMKQSKVKNNVVRRVSSVVEVIGYNPKKDEFDSNEFLKYNPETDDFKISENSSTISNLIELRGGAEESLWNEIEKRRRILDEMHKSKILEFREVSDIIKAYYKAPGDIFEYIQKFKKEDKNEVIEETR